MDLTENITVESWVYVRSTINNVFNVISKGHTSCSNPYSIYRLGKDDSTQKWTWDLGISGSRTRLISGSDIQTNVWTHLIATYDGVNMKIYINGVQDNYKAQTGSIMINNVELNVGDNPSCPQAEEYFNGIIDQVKIYNRSLSAEQVYQNYLNGINNYDLKNLVNKELNGGSTYKATLYATDGEDDSLPRNTSELSILNVYIPNSLPFFYLGYPKINSTDETNLTIKDLRTSFIATDADVNDRTLRFNITWYTNNLTNFSLNNLYYTNGTLKVEKLMCTNLTQGQTWKAQINLFDNVTNVVKNTSELLILNTSANFSQGYNDGNSFANVDIETSPDWINPGNAQASDNVYSTVLLNPTADPPNSDYLQATNFNFSMPGNAVINGILIEIEKNEGEYVQSSIFDKSVKIVKNDVISGEDKAKSAEWPTSDEYSSYGNSTDLWGLSWNSSDINTDNFGVAIATNITGANKDRTASIDNIRITVYYSSQDMCG